MEIDIIVKLIVGALSIVIAIILMNIKKKRLITTIFFFVALMFLQDVGLDNQLTDFYDFTVILMFISGFLPTIYPTFEGISYLRGIKKWQRRLKKSHLVLPDDPSHIEKIFQHAIAVNLGFDFHMNYGQKIRQSSSQRYPFLISSYETNHIYNSVHTTSYGSGSSSGGSFSTSSGSGGSGGGGGAGAF